jgi:S1-C subfamily serine protease
MFSTPQHPWHRLHPAGGNARASASTGLPRRAFLLALALTFGLAGSHASANSSTDAATADLGARSRALERAQRSVVGLRALALEGARSARTLGPLRMGSGVVIGADGLVLTIGYLVLEADAVLLQTSEGSLVPARVVAYDVATGLGLVSALAPLGVQPAPLAAGTSIPGQSFTVVSGGQDGEVGPVGLHSQGPFSGYWEYHLDRALLTKPARRDHSGAGLFNARGELVGIGSLVLADVNLQPGSPAAGPRQPGNMFVPADLLPPILGEMLREGRSLASRRAWMGVNCIEHEGTVRVLRITDDSPADLAGLLPGDRILRIDGQPVSALAALWKSLWAGGPAQRAVQLEVQRGEERRQMTVHAVDRAATLKRAEGI